MKRSLQFFLVATTPHPRAPPLPMPLHLTPLLAFVLIQTSLEQMVLCFCSARRWQTAALSQWPAGESADSSGHRQVCLSFFFSICRAEQAEEYQADKQQRCMEISANQHAALRDAQGLMGYGIAFNWASHHTGICALTLFDPSVRALTPTPGKPGNTGTGITTRWATRSEISSCSHRHIYKGCGFMWSCCSLSRIKQTSWQWCCFLHENLSLFNFQHTKHEDDAGSWDLQCTDALKGIFFIFFSFIYLFSVLTRCSLPQPTSPRFSFSTWFYIYLNI